MKFTFLKSKSIIMGLIIFLSIFLIILFYKSTTKNIPNVLLNNYFFKINVPEGWTLSSSNDDIFNKLIYNKETIASIEVFPECEFNESIESIVTNLYGVHVKNFEKLYTKKINSLELSKVTISFEQSAAESYNNIPPATDQLHYFYVHNNMLIDFYVLSDSVDQNIIDNIAESLRLKK